MNHIIRFWNQNRKRIMIGIGAIVLAIVIVQLLNQIAKENNEQKNNNVPTQQEEDLPTKSMIGGDTIPVEVTKDNVKLIEDFIEQCNNGNITNAYNMLTEECKKVVFTTEEEFKKGYYNLIFTEKKLYGIENFRNSSGYYTYEIKFYQDALATGKVQNTDVYQDYITIDKAQGKISINSFIKETKINKMVEKNGIQIIVVSKEVYKDYEKYNLSVKNNTAKTILIDSKESTKSLYAVGSDNGRYPSYSHEIADNILKVREGSSRDYKIKINKIYNPSVTIRAICFTDIITDEEAYKNNKEERLTITVDF